MTARLLAAALGTLAGVAPAIADPPQLHSPAPTSTPDLDLTLKAKAAVAADPMLKSVNLLIVVLDGGVVAGGPVPSDAVKDRVGQVLRAVPGVRDVKVTCWVPAVTEDPLRHLVRERLAGSPPAKPAAPPPAAPPVLPPSPIPAPQPPGAEDRSVAAARPQPPALLPPLPDWRAGGTVVAQRFAPPAEAFLLDPAAVRPGNGYSPLPPPAPPAPAGPRPFPTIPPPAVPVVPGQDVAGAVDVVWRADPRFAGLRLDVRAGTVAITGRAADPGDAWELATAVRRVPGVDRVVVGRIEGR